MLEINIEIISFVASNDDIYVSDRSGKEAGYNSALGTIVHQTLVVSSRAERSRVESNAKSKFMSTKMAAMHRTRVEEQRTVDCQILNACIVGIESMVVA